LTINQQPQFDVIDHSQGVENLKGPNIFKINGDAYEAHVISPDMAPFLKDETKINDALFDAMNAAEHGTISGISSEVETTPERNDQANVIAIGRRAATLEMTRHFTIDSDSKSAYAKAA
jgi:hypothetical protein